MQRYEREMGLPIHRPAGKSSPTVMAFQAEIDKWVRSPRDPVDSPAKRRALRSKTNRLRADFLRIDSQIALTLSGIALKASDPARRRRAAHIARSAYNTIMRLREDTDLSGADRGILEANLRQLKIELRRLDLSA